MKNSPLWSHGPRKVGGTYYSGTACRTYTVLAILDDTWVRVQMDDGYVATHGTAWDERAGDRVVSQPEAVR